MPEINKLYTLREAAHILGISYSTLKNQIYFRRLTAKKDDRGHYVISREEIERYRDESLGKQQNQYGG